MCRTQRVHVVTCFDAPLLPCSTGCCSATAQETTTCHSPPREVPLPQRPRHQNKTRSRISGRVWCWSFVPARKCFSPSGRVKSSVERKLWHDKGASKQRSTWEQLQATNARVEACEQQRSQKMTLAGNEGGGTWRAASCALAVIEEGQKIPDDVSLALQRVAVTPSCLRRRGCCCELPCAVYCAASSGVSGSMCGILDLRGGNSISGLVVEYIVAIDVTRVRFPADALCFGCGRCVLCCDALR